MSEPLDLQEIRDRHEWADAVAHEDARSTEPLITQSLADIPALLEEVKRLSAALEKCRGILDGVIADAKRRAW